MPSFFLQLKSAVDWLLEEEQPSIRYLTLTQVLGRKYDEEVRTARELVNSKGWAAEILSKRHPGGWWASEKTLYRPKYVSTNWMLLILSDLSLARNDPRIRESCELWMKRFAKSDGGFNTEGAKTSELCIVGNTARALIHFGYDEDARVQRALRWIVREQKEDGGWHCWGKRGVIDAWEGLSALAAYPKQKWTRSMKRAAERGAEFYLERRLHTQGRRYGPWYRFHYPIHYYYDILVGLDFITKLGYGDDRRLAYAISLLKEKRRPDGRWNLDAVHPDLEGPYVNWYRRNPPIPFALERAGEQSKMITLIAMRVLSRVSA
jgi:hypothetical protein